MGGISQTEGRQFRNTQQRKVTAKERDVHVYTRGRRGTSRTKMKTIGKPENSMKPRADRDVLTKIGM